MRLCEGRVVVVTGAGRGLGREHALEFARQGAAVVVNDLGAERDGAGASDAPAHEVVEEIRGLGGQAVVNGDDVSDTAGAQRLIQTALDAFGDLHTLVNNAGVLRDRMCVNMTDDEWDTVIRVHLRGTFLPTRTALAYWRDKSKAGEQRAARVINTSSPAGLYGNIGQANYAAAKAGIAAFTQTTARECYRYGVLMNAIAPAALTRMTEDLPYVADLVAEAKAAGDAYHPLHATNVAPLVVWLGSDAAEGITGQMFHVMGGQVSVVEGWRIGPEVNINERWDPAALTEVVPGLVAKAQPALSLDGRTPLPIG
jgi:NAD(P)-dependent dehydrogenase (short-subunit alcohol dehydrogenase family)